MDESAAVNSYGATKPSHTAATHCGSETRAGAPRERECDSLYAGFKDGWRGLGLATGEGPEDPTPTPGGLERPGAFLALIWADLDQGRGRHGHM